MFYSQRRIDSNLYFCFGTLPQWIIFLILKTMVQVEIVLDILKNDFIKIFCLLFHDAK